MNLHFFTAPFLFSPLGMPPFDWFSWFYRFYRFYGVVRRIKNRAPRSIHRAMPVSVIQVTSHQSLVTSPLVLLIPNP